MGSSVDGGDREKAAGCPNRRCVISGITSGWTLGPFREMLSRHELIRLSRPQQNDPFEYNSSANEPIVIEIGNFYTCCILFY